MLGGELGLKIMTGWNHWLRKRGLWRLRGGAMFLSGWRALKVDPQFRSFAENEVDWQDGALARSAKAVVRNVLGKKWMLEMSSWLLLTHTDLRSSACSSSSLTSSQVLLMEVLLLPPSENGWTGTGPVPHGLAIPSSDCSSSWCSCNPVFCSPYFCFHLYFLC